MRKHILWFSLAVFLGFALWAAIAWKNFLSTPLVPINQQPVDYILKPGSSITTLANDLQQLKILNKPDFLIVLAYLKNANKKLQAGEYLFAPGITPNQLLEQIVAGKVIYRRFTLVEGWNFKQVLAALNNNPYVGHTLNNLSAAAIMEKIGSPLQNPEGLFLPATYHFTRGTTDSVLLRTAQRMMQKELQKAWGTRAENLLYQEPYQALIVASLIEKETARLEEKPVVAGVIIRRLKKDMLLQIDSAVIYGMGDKYHGRLDHAGLRADTPYNTYVHKGLPPTPIAMPSLSSIQAALHPDDSDALYFVSKGNGTHQFSATLKAQDHAVTQYQIKTNFPGFEKKRISNDCVKPSYLSPGVGSIIIGCKK